jgi:hypothetical protein
MKDKADDLDEWGVPILPVLRLSDSDAQMADVRDAADLHLVQAVVRLGSVTADPDDDEAEAQIDHGRRRCDAAEHVGSTDASADTGPTMGLDAVATGTRS